MGRVNLEIVGLAFVNRFKRYNEDALFNSQFYHEVYASDKENRFLSDNSFPAGSVKPETGNVRIESIEKKVKCYVDTFKETVTKAYGENWLKPLEIMGNPKAVDNKKVCYPENPEGGEGENFKWWMQNLKVRSKKVLPRVQSNTTKAPELPGIPE